jgi:hypothetical protein
MTTQSSKNRPEPTTSPGVPTRPLAKLQALIGKYLVMTPQQCLVVALWIVHTHCVQHFEQTPYLTVTSPQRQCGKSRLLELMELLVPQPWSTIMPSEAVLYRKIDAETPTLLLDEVDAIFAPKTADRYEAIRAVLNAGHRRGATVSRATNFGNDLVSFQVFCPKVLAGIGVLPATITDRSIPIRLQRKTRNEKVARFFLRTVRAETAPIFAGLETWAAQNGAALGAARPELPEQLSDRMQEGCEPLLAIADVLGYAKEARDALLTLFGSERADEKESSELLLLADVRDIFNKEGVTVLSSELLANLLAMNGNGWSSWYGRGITGRDIAALVKPYGIHSVNVRTEDGVRKGYKWDDFHPVFDRYLPPVGAEAEEVGSGVAGVAAPMEAAS